MIDATLPHKYESLISQLDYEAIFYKAIAILGKFGDIKSAKDGEIVVTGAQYTTENLHFYTYNENIIYLFEFSFPGINCFIE